MEFYFSQLGTLDKCHSRTANTYHHAASVTDIGGTIMDIQKTMCVLPIYTPFPWIPAFPIPAIPPIHPSQSIIHATVNLFL
ncbi:hypothetical protein VTJ04DRAFT_9775 [Mycothermus thermophilus]|uniref:uncharacterized protein n=1 Tax=Humicola insolens TaxID=85995 RepID=UPI00374245A2